jgi:thymidylate synthase
MNPDPSYERWPWWNGQEVSKQAGEQFTHTYSERFWPPFLEKGIRYEYGNFNDLLRLLKREKYTRQAYLPIFFPEDTGTVHGGRVPCTLGYHFMLRENRLSMWYFIRSCDLIRHFRDDLYLSARLLVWVLEECKNRTLEEDGGHDGVWDDVRPGYFTFICPSLHYHRGDEHLVES